MNCLFKAAILAATLLGAPAASETVLGVYIVHRHGDRTSKSIPPTQLTPLGASQVFRSGEYFRSLYVAGNGTRRIAGLAPEVAVNSQLNLFSPVDVVLQNSAQVFAQGLYPPTPSGDETLADGSRSQAPLGGYQYVPVEVVASAATASGAESNTWLQGASGCDKAVLSSNSYFSSREYLDTLDSTRGFYQGLLPAINRTFKPEAANFKNGYAIYDIINVAEIHNATYAGKDLITPDVFHQLSTRADQHEWGLAFNASEPVRAIAGAVLAGQVLRALNATLTGGAAPRLNVQFGAYATFASFFGLARLHELAPEFTGLVRYASSAVFELVTNSTGAGDAAGSDDVAVRFRFANGTATEGNPLAPFPLFGLGEAVLPWTIFAREMGRIAVADTAHWCEMCGSSTGACAAGQAKGPGAGASATSANVGGISAPVAGVIGALVTLVVVVGTQTLVMALTGFRVVKKPAAGKNAGVGKETD